MELPNFCTDASHDSSANFDVENKAQNSAEQQRDTIRSMFNSIAPTYDFLNHLLSFGIDKRWRKRTIQEMNLDSASRVLDLATGTGDLAEQAQKRNPEFIVGADPAFFMLVKTKDKLNNAQKKMQPSTPFYAVESFGEFLPFAKKSFTHAMISYGIRNVSNREQVFAEIHRVLKPKGIFAVLEFSQSPNRFFAALYAFYFYKLLPFVGGIVSGNKEAYRYLPRSVEEFPPPQELIRELQRAGFAEKKILPMFFGITTLIIVEKNIEV